CTLSMYILLSLVAFFSLFLICFFFFFFFFQAEDGIRDFHVTGVQTCALPISARPALARRRPRSVPLPRSAHRRRRRTRLGGAPQIGRASCRERVEISVVAGS